MIVKVLLPGNRDHVPIPNYAIQLSTDPTRRAVDHRHTLKAGDYIADYFEVLAIPQETNAVHSRPLPNSTTRRNFMPEIAPVRTALQGAHLNSSVTINQTPAAVIKQFRQKPAHSD
ncbi:hypothetical protein IIA79_06265 [bacterium]|nr:hypothetical protein [bacterium]